MTNFEFMLFEMIDHWYNITTYIMAEFGIPMEGWNYYLIANIMIVCVFLMAYGLIVLIDEGCKKLYKGIIRIIG